MRRPHPTILLLLALLFAGETVFAVAAPCQQVKGAERRDCCTDGSHGSADGECHCAARPDDPVNTEPVVRVQPVQIVATLSPAVESTPDTTPRRLTIVEPLRLPAPPPQRAHDVRAPPVLW